MSFSNLLAAGRFIFSGSQITITGKATTYNAVTKFYNNLSRSGLFEGVTLGRTFETADGVSFSLTCGFAASVGTDEQEVVAES